LCQLLDIGSHSIRKISLINWKDKVLALLLDPMSAAFALENLCVRNVAIPYLAKTLRPWNWSLILRWRGDKAVQFLCCRWAMSLFVEISLSAQFHCSFWVMARHMVHISV
jgi:hypothetical protein